MKPIISIENLGKKYLIKHNSGGARYKTLRDTLTELPQKLLHAGRSSPSLEEFWALQDINFDVMPGDRIGIIGRNGAGKSTLLKLLSRITEPTTGRITLRGRVASLLEVGTGFHPELTGRENIFLNGAILGMHRNEIQRKFDEIVDFSGVEKFLDTPVKRYSSGMYVRLAFAVAAHLEPEILIVDEVLAVGDAEFQKKCLGKMEEVSKGQGRTVLFVSHNINIVSSLCTKGVYLSKGQIDTASTAACACEKYKQDQKSTTEIVQTRSGTGVARIVTISSIITKQQVHFHGQFTFFIQASQTILEPEFGFSIHDEQGHTLSISYANPKDISLNIGTNEIIATAILPFSQGSYSIRARIAKSAENIDFPHGDIYTFAIPAPQINALYRPETMRNGLVNLTPNFTVKN